MAGFYQSLIADWFPWEHGHRREFFRNLLLQIYFTFVQSVLMVSVLGLLSGMAIAFQTNFGLSLLGNNSQLGKVLVFVIPIGITVFLLRVPTRGLVEASA